MASSNGGLLKEFMWANQKEQAFFLHMRVCVFVFSLSIINYA